MPETAAPAARFITTRQNGRPVVLDQTTGKATQTRTRAAAEEKAAKLNRQHEAETRTASAEDAVANFYAQFQANRRALDSSIRQAPTGEVAANADAPAVQKSAPLAALEKAVSDAIANGSPAITAVEAPKAKAPAQRKPRTPKVVQPGETTRVYRIAPGQTVTLRGIGTVTVVGNVKVDVRRNLVEYTSETGATGSVELGADAQAVLVS